MGYIVSGIMAGIAVMRFNAKELIRRYYVYIIPKRVSLIDQRVIGEYIKKGIQIHLIQKFMRAQKLFI